MKKNTPIFDLLKKDHDEVSELLHELEEAGPRKAADLLIEISRKLTAHSRAEESVFYGRLLHSERTRSRILEGLEEHKQVDTLLLELDRLQPRDEKFKAKAGVLRENVGHHVDEEEGELFPLARQIISEEEAIELGQQFAAERERHLRDLSKLDESAAE